MSILCLGKPIDSVCGERKRIKSKSFIELFFFTPIFYLLVLPMISKMEKQNGLRLNYFNLNLSSVVLGFLSRRMEIIDCSLC